MLQECRKSSGECTFFYVPISSLPVEGQRTIASMHLAHLYILSYLRDFASNKLHSNCLPTFFLRAEHSICNSSPLQESYSIALSSHVAVILKVRITVSQGWSRGDKSRWTPWQAWDLCHQPSVAIMALYGEFSQWPSSSVKLSTSSSWIRPCVL